MSRSAETISAACSSRRAPRSTASAAPFPARASTRNHQRSSTPQQGGCMRFLLAVLCAVLLAGCQTSPTTSTFASPLAGLANPHAGAAMHEGSWDRTGGNADMRRVEPGQTLTLLDHNGAGIIRRLWVTIAPRAHQAIHRQ